MRIQEGSTANYSAYECNNAVDICLNFNLPDIYQMPHHKIECRRLQAYHYIKPGSRKVVVIAVMKPPSKPARIVLLISAYQKGNKQEGKYQVKLHASYCAGSYLVHNITYGKQQ